MSDAHSLTEVPYIGEHRAEAFVEAGLDSPERVAKASPELLEENIYGLGRTDAERIVEGARELTGTDTSETLGADALTAAAGTRRASAYESVETQLGPFGGAGDSEADDAQANGNPPNPLSQLEGITELSLDLDPEAPPAEYQAERFERRLVQTDEGMLYRRPDGERVPPEEAPGYDAWRELHGGA